MSGRLAEIASRPTAPPPATVRCALCGRVYTSPTTAAYCSAADAVKEMQSARIESAAPRAFWHLLRQSRQLRRRLTLDEHREYLDA